VRLHSILVALVFSLVVEPAWAQQQPATPSTSPTTQTPSAPAAQSAPTALPPVVVVEPSETPKTKAPKKASKKKGPSVAAGPAATQPTGTQTAAGALAAATTTLNDARNNMLTKVGTNQYTFSQQALESLPQGTNAPFSKAILQAPGVTQDSVASGQIHVRNEHANVQYRINGIILPDGVSGFSQVLDTTFIGSMALITGALPAEFGLHTSGIIDIQTRSGAFNSGGSVGVYGGSRDTLTPSFEYGGTSGQTEYFVTGRYLQTNEGIENPTPSVVPIHDHSEQGALFSYVSKLLDPDTRLSWISGSTINQFQIPNTPGLAASYAPTNFNSALLNENQFEQNYYNVVALQKKIDNGDWQLAYFSRYSDLHFTPDEIGDLAFNGVASNVQRQSFINGLQGDGSYRINDTHTLRGGFYVSGEQTDVSNASSALLCKMGVSSPCSDPGDVSNTQSQQFDETSKLGWLLGVYLQDEWKITSQLTLNAGIRFDQMYQFVDANQWSPRVSLVYKPFDGTTLHAGYARYFTPPSQVIATPTNVAAFDDTTQASETCGGNNQPACGPVLPERAHYFDVGIVQRIFPGLEVGVDGYYKLARDLLDDGQFGAALVLDGFNYAKAYNEGIEIKANYAAGNFRAYGNIAIAQQKGTNIVSNQYLIGLDDLNYIANHYIFTDHSQTVTASAGVSYLWQGTRFSADMIYGSGLRSDGAVPNGAHVPGYTQVNLGMSHEFKSGFEKPATLRLDVINLFDNVYQIRNGDGIGVFAPQYGPRREFLVGLSQKF